MDSYTKVCSICEDIKNLFGGYGNEDAVIVMASAIIREAKKKKSLLLTNTKQCIVHQLNEGKEEIVIPKDSAFLFSSLLDNMIKQDKEENG